MRLKEYLHSTLPLLTEEPMTILAGITAGMGILGLASRLASIIKLPGKKYKFEFNLVIYPDDFVSRNLSHLPVGSVENSFLQKRNMGVIIHKVDKKNQEDFVTIKHPRMNVTSIISHKDGEDKNYIDYEIRVSDRTVLVDSYPIFHDRSHTHLQSLSVIERDLDENNIVTGDTKINIKKYLLYIKHLLVKQAIT